MDTITTPVTVTVFSLTVDGSSGSITTQVFATENEALDSLIENYAPDDGQTRETIIDELTERQGIVLYLDEHTVTTEASA